METAAFGKATGRKMVEFLRAGIVTEPHGIRGEIKVFPTTDDVTRFERYGELFVERNGKTPEESGGREVRKITSVKYQKERVILKLEGIETRDDAELLRKAELYVHRSRSAPLKEGEFFTADLYGLQVFTEDGRKVGTVEDVLKTGANDVFSIRKEDGKELLLPKADAFVRNIDVEAGRMTVFLVPGIEDL